MELPALILIGGMAVVTYLPRLAPLILLQHLKLPPFLVRFMKFIPYAALAALIFPGGLQAAGTPAAALAGLAAAMLLAYCECNLMLVVAGGIGGTLLLVIQNTP